MRKIETYAKVAIKIKSWIISTQETLSLA